jgi:hypothetical protein
MTPKQYQTALTRAGFALGAIDGKWGPKTAAASADWFASGRDIAVGDGPSLPPPPPPAPKPDLIPADWLTPAAMRRVITHWTAGAYAVSALDREHYHIIIAGDGALVRGDHSIADNVNTGDGDYAAHTRGCNTGSIGVSVACMAGAQERPFVAGPYPMTLVQWTTMARVVAQLCRAYKIPVSPVTVLGHGEVQRNLGIAQAGKWDPMILPWAPTLTFAEVGNKFRAEVQRFLAS